MIFSPDSPASPKAGVPVHCLGASRVIQWNGSKDGEQYDWRSIDNPGGPIELVKQGDSEVLWSRRRLEPHTPLHRRMGPGKVRPWLYCEAMPDWSYRPLLRPVLFRFEAQQARSLTLTVLRQVGGHWLGWQFLDHVGRLRPHPSLQRTLLGLTFRAPVGLGRRCGRQAVAGLRTFGLGFLEVGPLTLEPVILSPSSRERTHRALSRETLRAGERPINQGAWAARTALGGQCQPDVPLLAHLSCVPGASGSQITVEWLELIHILHPVVDVFTLDLSASEAQHL